MKLVRGKRLPVRGRTQTGGYAAVRGSLDIQSFDILLRTGALLLGACSHLKRGDSACTVTHANADCDPDASDMFLTDLA